MADKEETKYKNTTITSFKLSIMENDKKNNIKTIAEIDACTFRGKMTSSDSAELEIWLSYDVLEFANKIVAYCDEKKNKLLKTHKTRVKMADEEETKYKNTTISSFKLSTLRKDHEDDIERISEIDVCTVRGKMISPYSAELEIWLSDDVLEFARNIVAYFDKK